MGRPPVEARPGLLAVILATTATAISVNSLLVSSLSEILRGVGASVSDAGLVAGAATLPGIVMAPVIGLLADRYGRRTVLVPCLLLFGIAGALAGTSTTLGALVAWRLLQGTGAAGLINLAVVLIADHWVGQRRATMIGRNVAVLTVGLSLFPLIGGLVTDRFGWRAVFALYLVALPLGVVVARILEGGDGVAINFTKQLRLIPQALRRPAVLPALIATTLIFVVISAVILTVLPIYLAETFQLTPTARGMVLGLPAAANIAASLSAARLPLSKRAVLISGTLALTVALLLMVVVRSVTGVVVGMVVFGAGEGVMLPTIQGIVADVGASSRGAVIALYTSAKNIGQTTGPVIAGLTLGMAGQRTTMIVVTLVVATLLLPLVVKFIPDLRPRPATTV